MIVITSEADLDQFLHHVDNFHDTIFREARIFHPGYVDDSGGMHLDSSLENAYLFFQSQFIDEVPGFVILARNIHRFTIRGPQSPFDYINGKFSNNRVTLATDPKHDAQFFLECESISYELLDKTCLGKCGIDYNTMSPVPSPRLPECEAD